MKNIIISVHIPKAGGTSFKRVLEQEYGNKVLFDYRDKPLNKDKKERISQCDLNSFKK